MSENDIEGLRRLVTRALLGCCDVCRGLLRRQLQYEEQMIPWPPETTSEDDS